VSVQPKQPHSGTGSLRRFFGAAAAVAEELLTRRRPAVARPLASRERRTEAVAAGLFVLVALAMAAAIAGHFDDGVTAGLLVLCYALLRRVRFQLGPGLIRPTQLAFVPMAFLTPAPWLPALVGLASVLGELPDVLRRRAPLERVLVVLADSWYSVGPALVIAAAGANSGEAAGWGVLLVALAAQFAVDLAASSAREWFGAGIRPLELIPVLALVYLIDATFTPIGYLGVLAAEEHRFAYLLAIAPGAVLGLLAEERNARMAHEIELERAFRRGTRALTDRTAALRSQAGSLRRPGRRFGEAVAAPQDRAVLERVLLGMIADAVQADGARLSLRVEDGLQPRLEIGAGERLGDALAAAEATPGCGAGPAAALAVGEEHVVAVARESRSFSPVECELIEHLAAQAALALENLRLGELISQAEGELRAILESVAEAVVVEDASGRLVYGNPVADALIGDAPDLASSLGVAPTLLPGDMALIGESTDPIVVRHDDGRRWSRVKASPVGGEHDRTHLAVSIVEDITEIKQAEEAQRFLAESSRVLASSLDLRDTLPRVERLAEALLGGEWTIEIDETPRGTASQRGEALTVPIRVRGGVAGTITRTGGPAGPLETAVAEDLGLRVGAAIDIARLSRARAVITQSLHTSLLPPPSPAIPGLETAALYRPASAGHDIGGDFYDVFSTDPDVWFLLIGDVRGKGTAAVAAGALTRTAIRAAAMRHRAPSAILRRLNSEMLARQAGAFVTIACVRLDIQPGVVTATVSCGGHPIPRILRADGVVEAFGTAGTLLGVLSSVRLENTTTRLYPGDALILYTDGLTHAAEPVHWTPEQLHTVIFGAFGRSAEGIVDHIAATVEGPLRDDLALLAARVEP
jgi:PAS domain-containing protein